MKEPLRILVAGGDRRQKYAAQMLAQQPAFSVTTVGSICTIRNRCVIVTNSHQSRKCAVSLWGTIASVAVVQREGRRFGVRRNASRSSLPDVSGTKAGFLRLFSAGGALPCQCCANGGGGTANRHVRTGKNDLRQSGAGNRLR